MQTTTLKSDNAYYLYLLLLIGGGCFFFFLAYQAFIISIAPPYWQLVEGIGAILMAIGGVACFAYITRFDTIHIDSDALTVNTIWGSPKQTIALKNITGYTETTHKYKNRTYYKLTVYTAADNYQITSSYYDNYDQLKALLTYGKVRNTALEQQLNSRKQRIVVALALAGGAVTCIIGFCTYTGINRSANPSLTQLTGVIINQPHITKGSKGARSVLIKIEQYPNFNFAIKGKAYRAFQAYDYVNNVNAYDTVQLDIIEDALQMKLTQQKPLTFSAKHFDYYGIDVYGLRDNNRVYLEPAGLLTHEENDVLPAYIFFGSGLFGIGLGVFFLFRAQQP